MDGIVTLLVWPNGTTKEPIVSDAWGYRGRIPGLNTRPWHTGQDWHSIGALRAIGAGTVIESGKSSWAGWYVLIYLGEIDGERTWVMYCHLAARSHLGRGDQVSLGDLVGFEGATGVAAGIHLHLEIYRGRVDRGDGNGPASTVDPREFIRSRLTATLKPVGQEEDEDMAKNIGMVYTRSSDNATIVLIGNTVSGFEFEYTGPDNGPMPADHNNPLAASFDTGPFIPTREYIADAFKKSLRQVRDSLHKG